VAMTSVLLVFQMGQPRIWMSMSRDGLMPKKFSKIHKKYKTPSYATIITGLVVGIPILFVDYNWVIDFTSISTLFAFVLVCGGVLLLPDEPKDKSKFSLPKIGSRFPLLALLGGLLVWGLWHEDGSRYFSSLVQMLPDDKTFSLLGVSFFQYADNNVNNIALLIFYGLLIVFTGLAVVKNFTLIPVLGLLSCAYLLTSMTILNWMYFLIWMLIGLVVYFLYSHKNSKLHV
jgi:APA family basic amino acid/polyamine antiporter